MWLEIVRTKASVYHSHNIHPGPAVWLVAKPRRARLIYDAHELYGELREGGGLRAEAARRTGVLLERNIQTTLRKSASKQREPRHSAETKLN
jgi:hypothetical protein